MMLRGGDSLYRTEQAIRLAVDARREVERVRVAAESAVAEYQSPQAGIEERLAVGAGERAQELPGRRIEGVDRAVVEGKVADQQVAAELAKGRRSQGDAPRRGQLAADNQLAEEMAAGIKNRHRSLPRRCLGLGGVAGRSVGHVQFAVDVLHVERDQLQVARQ